MKSDRIFIIGAGAIGKTLAAFLKAQGNEVILLRGQADEINDSMVTIKVLLNDKDAVKTEVLVSAVSNFTNLDGIVVIASKSYGNELIAERLKKRIGNAPVVILQNGLNVELPFVHHGFERIYRCILFATAQQVSADAIRFKPVAASPVGVVRGSSEELSGIIDQFSNPYFTFRAEQDIQRVIWTKTIANCVFNSVCPLLETDNGIFYRDEQARSVAKRVIAECISVAETQGVFLDAADVFDRLLQISKSSEGQLISTYQDILNGRKTEIETLNMAVAEIADNARQETMVPTTRLLGELIRIKSGIAMRASL
ncbi:ketopantoate reductase family protein [Sediminibacterium ginsengisoli]|uniref:2-dehydropantoate 2-reductase n=1 Tax=Sediminibacterium ginsengisoli TaxID=413434 RepID=A0A1T4LB80_9BACT|nr:2-dehydropantoate 2-reductase [Sediminibacterium ginsengisoli]SJZ51861.1 2-dehydropantoate 2-reductase [Sediminibacterium ginsengisoli]